MKPEQGSDEQLVRTACCACGSLCLSLRGEPVKVYACACLECQRATGSAFGYRARFKQQSIISAVGETRRYRRFSAAGLWMDNIFCPRCGTLVYMEAEVLDAEIAVSVGCFADPGFAAPSAIFWAQRKHAWYGVEDSVRLVH